MKKPILALIDSSIYANPVCDLALWAAKSMQTTIRLLHVLDKSEEEISLPNTKQININNNIPDLSILEQTDPTFAKALFAQKVGQTILEEAKNYLNSHSEIEIETRLRHGTLLDALNIYSNQSSMIVMGKRGEQTASDKKRLGLNFENVVRSSELPILVASRHPHPIQRILIAFDGGPLIMKAIDFICSKESFKNITFILGMAERQTQAIQNSFNAALARLQSAGFNTESLKTEINFEQMILHNIEPLNLNMILMGAFHHSKMHNFLFGSKSQAIIHKAPVPVMIMREL
ncbi:MULTISPECIES: universal stress protein [unclassified Bartonella]|uniref:universal stress protein n=1 Tax=unclassified Bartonella TaxID=2645622 RepID=UPI00099AF8D5|nr:MULTISPECIES: universal stress protein [unclassified Bartonella]AQX28340.1 Nucleotide-binding universal stress protein, UspA family [Bartonella sp. JB15]AQX29609.1 Nucleotide-binding universal stress protein, UspA family [Bartonella sp. JB63]